MLDGQVTSGPTSEPAPIPADNGPQPPNQPVAPGSGVPTNDPATNPSAPPNHPDSGTTEAQADFDIAKSAMADGSPDNFLRNFLEDNGLDVSQPILPQVAGQPGQPAAPPQVQPGNGQVPPNGQQAPQPQQPPQINGVDASMVQRLMQGPQPGAFPQQPPAPQAFPQPVQPQAHQPFPQQPQQPQPAAQPSADPNAPVVLFNEPFVLPDQIKAALDHEDPNVRATAIGAAMAAAANTTAQRVIEHLRQNELPAVAQATVGHVQRQQVQETLQRDLYGPFPHLRYASPALIQQAANIVVQDELARNPGATVTPQVLHRIGQLASEGLRQMAAGQTPQFQPPQAQPQPQVQYAPQPAYVPQAPQPVWDGHQWVLPQAVQPQQVAAAPPSQPYVAGMSAAPFGMPTGQGLATPESEVAAFLQGGWG